MPPHSTVKEFVKALQTRKTNTTIALDQLFSSPGQYRNKPLHTNLSRSGALGRPLPAWARKELRDRGVSNAELNHINKWPNTQKEAIRKKLVEAIQNGRKVQFFWELHGRPGEETDIKPDPDTGQGVITITFRSPQRRARVSSAAGTFGEVFVDVG